MTSAAAQASQARSRSSSRCGSRSRRPATAWPRRAGPPAPADPVAARVADDDPPEPGQERAEQDEAGAHLGGGLERHEQPLDVARGDLVACSARVRSTTTPRSLQCRATTRTSSMSGHVRQAAALAGQRRCGHQLERGVLRAADGHRAAERPATLDAEELPGHWFRPVLPVERSSVSHADYRRDAADPRGARRSATRIRSSASELGSRAGQVGGFAAGLPERPFGLAARLLGLLEVDLLGACRRSRPSRPPCPAGPAGSRRRWRTIPRRRPCGCAAHRPRAVVTSGAWCGRMPSSPSLPGRTTASTVVRIGEPLRRDDLELQTAWVRPPAWRRSRGRRRACRPGRTPAPERVDVALEDLLERGNGLLDAHVLARTGP